MVRTIKKYVVVVAACLTLVLGVVFGALLGGCSGHPNTAGPLTAMASPAIPSSAQEIANPLRGQYEDLMEPLFPQAAPAQQRYPAWPASSDASLRVTWRQLQPVDPRTLPPDTPDDRRYDFSVIDDALAKLSERGMRLMLRVLVYNSCCNATYPDNTNIEIPDWERARPGASTSYPGTPAGVTQVVPNFNDPSFLDDFGQLLAALGRRYDNDERLSVFEFSGYGDASGNHIGYLRDSLNAAGPDPDHSEATLGYYSQFRDQSITRTSIQQLVTANVNAFPHTQLVVTPNNPEIVRQLLADDATKRLATPVGIRSDCLGVDSPLPTWAESSTSHYVQNQDPLVGALKKRLSAAPVISEWCRLPSGTSPQSYYERGLHDVLRFHVSMTSSINFPDQTATSPMDPKLYQLWAQANATAGYRYSVEARPGTQALQGNAATISVTWTNYGSAAATERWVPGYRLVDFAGRMVRALPATVDLRGLVPDASGDLTKDQPTPAAGTETVRVDLQGLSPGHYTLRAVVEWQQHKPAGSPAVNYPPMQLARDGRDATGFYPIATLDISREVQTMGNGANGV